MDAITRFLEFLKRNQADDLTASELAAVRLYEAWRSKSDSEPTLTLDHTPRTNENYARLICFECADGGRPVTISAAEYGRQLTLADKGWQCPACKHYGAAFDDDFIEQPLERSRG